MNHAPRDRVFDRRAGAVGTSCGRGRGRPLVAMPASTTSRAMVVSWRIAAKASQSGRNMRTCTASQPSGTPSAAPTPRSRRSLRPQGLLGGGHLARLVTLDDLDVRAAAHADPQGFVTGLGDGAVIDEVQRVPERVLAVKANVDRDRRPGRFLLTGSANPFHRQDETLAGRREDVSLWTLAQAELEQTSGELVNRLFDDDPLPVLRTAAPVDGQDVVKRALRGGYPEMLQRTQQSRVDAWYRSYITEVVQHEIADLAAIEGLLDMPKLMRLLAHRNTGLLNTTKLARDADLPPQTTWRYLALLVEAFIVTLLPAWTRSGRKRLVKSPKVVLTDSGLAAHLADITVARLDRSPEMTGSLLEGFVLNELRRLRDWSELRPEMYHFRSEQGHEIGAVFEDRAGRVVGIEVKSRVSIAERDFRGIDALADIAGPSFHLGLVLHPGQHAIQFGTRRWAAPLSLLWT
jgi:predicted AAA+ superfamily ATPase